MTGPQFAQIISDAIRFGWDNVRTRFGFFFKLLLLVGLFFIIQWMAYWFLFGFFITLFSPGSPFDPTENKLLYLMSFLIPVIVLSPGIKHIALMLDDGASPHLRDFFHGYHHFWRYVGASILYYSLVWVGLLIFAFITEVLSRTVPQGLFIVPLIAGPLLLVRYRFAGFIVLDHGTTIREAFRESNKITKGYLLNLFLLYGGLLLLLYYPVLSILNLFPESPTAFNSIAWTTLLLLAGGALAFALILLPDAHIYRSLWRAAHPDSRAPSAPPTSSIASTAAVPPYTVRSDR